MTAVLVPPDHCVIWNCGRPLRGPDGSYKGHRGMCWMHLKQAQREGGLKPWWSPPKPTTFCKDGCGKPATRAGRCRPCYDKHWRANTPGREAMLARQREQKREYMRKRREQKRLDGSPSNSVPSAA